MNKQSIRELIEKAAGTFKKAGIDTPRLDAEVLLAEALKCDRAHLYGHPEETIKKRDYERFKKFVARRRNREPIAYITGKKEFWDRDFIIKPGVLIPRPDTETLIESVIGIYKITEYPDGHPKIIEIGVGSGNIAVTLACEIPGSEIWGTDPSKIAINIANKNAKKHEILDRVHFFRGDLFEPLSKNLPSHSFHFIVSNPPYIPSQRIQRLAPEITKYEPLESLDGGKDGLSVIRQIIKSTPTFLRSGGHLVFEIDPVEVGPISKIAESLKDWHELQIKKDLAGKDRVIVLKRT